jgi:hypothetical protein
VASKTTHRHNSADGMLLPVKETLTKLQNKRAGAVY